MQFANGGMGGEAVESDSPTRGRCADARSRCGGTYWSLSGTQNAEAHAFTISGDMYVQTKANQLDYTTTTTTHAEFRGTLPSGTAPGSVEMTRNGETFYGELTEN